MNAFLLILPLLSIGWPLAPQNATHELGNNWGEFQDYGGYPYCHPGIDVMGMSIGRPVYAVQKGTVKAWLTTQAEWHWRLAIADTNISTDSVEAWLYAHIDANQYHKNVGDNVTEGELIGYLVEWPVPGFDHCHFARIKDIGTVWNTADWAFVQNPLVIITPYADTAKPVFENAYGANKFALCTNNTSTYISPTNITGSIDIIARIYDKTGLALPQYPVWERLIPFRITYEIHGPQNVPNRLSFVFKGYFNYDNYVSTIYKDDATCNTQGDYDFRDYYFIVTNTDGDSLVESGDASYSWNTTSIPAGHYWIVISAYDAAGNFKTDSMEVIKTGPRVEEGKSAENSLSPVLIPNPIRARELAPLSSVLKNNNDAVLYNNNGQALSINTVSALPEGVYFLVVKKDNRVQTHKIVAVK